MSGDIIARAAVLAALRADPILAGQLNSIDDGDPPKASAPWLRIGETGMSAWGARGVDGMTVRLPLQFAIRGDAASTAPDIAARIDTVLGGMATELADGWRITSLRCERTRFVRRQSEWRAAADYSIRIARLR